MAAEPEGSAREVVTALAEIVKLLRARLGAMDLSEDDRTTLNERLGDLTADTDRLIDALRNAVPRLPLSLPLAPAISQAERDTIVAEMQAQFSDVPRDVSLVDELLAARRREAERERE